MTKTTRTLDEDEGMADALIGYLNDAQNSIDRWIKEGGIKQHIDTKVFQT